MAREAVSTVVDDDSRTTIQYSSRSRNLASFLGAESSAERIDHPGFIRKLAGLEFRVDQLAVDRQLEAAATAGYQLQLADLLLERSENLGRQTDGPGFVVSHRAILQFQIHRLEPPGR